MNKTALKSALLALGLGFVTLTTQPVLAAADHARARQALQSGEILPLDKILAKVSASQPGQILEVELDDERAKDGKIWVYEIKGVAPDGRLFKMKVDARTAEILESRSKPRERQSPAAR
ncbi:PepSY domain-containing protein [beta proteobacterium MWH-UniP1]